MAENPGPRPEIVNGPVNEALEKARANPVPGSIWDVVRQLGHGGLTLVNIPAENPAPEVKAPNPFDPTSLPGDLASPPPQSVLAIGSEKGPLLVAFTARNVGNLLPNGGPSNFVEQQVSALEVAAIAGKAPYVGLALDPGSENGLAIPAEFLNAGIPIGRTNPQAKAIMGIPNLGKAGADPAARQALVEAVARGPVYTAVEKGAFEATGEYKFPLIPINTTVEPGESPDPNSEAAVVFGTSPAEILVAFSSDQWVPLPVRMNDVVKTLQDRANVRLVVINPSGPTLQLPINGTSTTAASSDTASSDEILTEPTPEPGPATEPDAGTREGED